MSNVIDNLLINSYNEKVRNVRSVRNMNKDRNNLPLSSKVTSKGQITIPKEVREKLGINNGDVIGFYPQGDYYLFGDLGSLINKELDDTAKMVGFKTSQDLCDWIKNEIRPEVIKKYIKEHNSE